MKNESEKLLELVAQYSDHDPIFGRFLDNLIINGTIVEEIKIYMKDFEDYYNSYTVNSQNFDPEKDLDHYLSEHFVKSYDAEKNKMLDTDLPSYEIINDDLLRSNVDRNKEIELDERSKDNEKDLDF